MSDIAPGDGTCRTELFEEKDGLEHITEGYFRYTDVVFEWSKVLNPWHVSVEESTIIFSSLPSQDR